MNEDVKDIYVDENLTPAVTAQGEVLMVSGVQVILQDIALRLKTPLGSLFYDEEFGSLLYLFKNDENTAVNRQAIIAEIENRIDLDTRVIPLSVSASVISWDKEGISVSASFRLYETETEYFMHISIGDDINVVVQDA
ncbi:MAG: baseplate assembly protein [Deferribacterales bacterium]